MSEITSGFVAWPEDVAARYRAAGLWTGETLWDIVATRAEEDPTRVALIDGVTALSFDELVRRATICAEGLHELGLARGDRVVVQLPNTWRFVVLILACFRLGIAPVMALPAHREHELRHLISLSEAVALVTPDVHRGFDHGALARGLRAESPFARHVIIDAENGETSDDHADVFLGALCADRGAGYSIDLPPQPSPSDIACFLLSGGTTGLPKLISRTHDDYALNVRLCAAVSLLDRDAVYLGTLPISHNFPLACPGVLGTLFTGATTVILPSSEPQKVFAAIAAHGVTHAAAVPAVTQAWLERAKQVGSHDLATLRVLQVGGARLADELAAQVEPMLGATLQQVFGMAEGLINMTRIDDSEAVIQQTQGRPVCDADEIKVVDEDGVDVQPGQPGVLLTRGPYTPRGYYRADEHNAVAFTQDGWYITGDVVRIVEHGNMIVEGRTKDMINRGGEKISAEEIENLVYRVPGISLVAAVAMPDPDLGERVCVFITQTQGAELTLEQLVQSFQDWGVAAYKRPERLIRLAELPLTKVGKVDKKALREMLAEGVIDRA